MVQIPTSSSGDEPVRIGIPGPLERRPGEPAPPAEAALQDREPPPGPQPATPQVAGATTQLLKQVVDMLKRGGDEAADAADDIRAKEYEESVGKGGDQQPGSEQDVQDALNALDEDPAAAQGVDPMQPDMPAEEQSAVAPASAAPERAPADEQISQDILNNYQGYTDQATVEGLSDFNAANLETDDGVLGMIEATSQKYAAQMDEAKRGVIPNEVTRQMADLLGQSQSAVIRRTLNLKPGQLPNHAEMLAMRDVLVWSGAKLDDLAVKARDGGDPESLLAFRKHLALHAALQSKIKGAQTEIGRALQSFNIPAGGADRNAAISEALSDVASGSPDEIAKMARAYLQLQTPQQKNNFVRRGVFKKGYDAAFEVWMNSILSAPTTHMMNFLGNSIMLFDDSLNRAVAAHMIPKARALAGRPNRGGGVAKGEATAQAFGVYMAFMDALRAAGKTFKDNAPPETVGGSKIDFAPARRNAFSGEGLEISNNGFAQAMDLLGSVATLGRLSSRTMESTDVFFKVMSERMERYALAYRKTQGLGPQERVSAMVDLINDPTPTMTDAARVKQQYVTLQSELGPKWKGIQNIARIPVLNFFMPFIKTPANSMKRSLERTPFAPFMKEVRETVAAGGPEADLALARMATGSAMMMTFAALAAQGVITGGGPADPEVRRGWRESGWQPYSMKVGDKYISYARFEPYATFMGLAADIGEIGRDAYESGVLDDPQAQRQMEDIIAALSFSVAENVTNKTFMEGVSTGLDAVRNPEAYGGRAIENIVSGFVPNVFNVANRALFDEKIRYTRGLVDAFRKRVPGFSDELPATYDVFGRERTYTQIGYGVDLANPFFLSEEKQDWPYQALVEYDVPVGRISETVPQTSGELKLLPHEYAWLTWRAGNLAYEYVQEARELEDWGRGSWLGRRLILREAISTARSQAKQEIFERFEELQGVVRKFNASKEQEMTR